MALYNTKRTYTYVVCASQLNDGSVATVMPREGIMLQPMDFNSAFSLYIMSDI